MNMEMALSHGLSILPKIPQKKILKKRIVEEMLSVVTERPFVKES